MTTTSDTYTDLIAQAGQARSRIGFHLLTGTPLPVLGDDLLVMAWDEGLTRIKAGEDTYNTRAEMGQALIEMADDMDLHVRLEQEKAGPARVTIGEVSEHLALVQLPDDAELRILEPGFKWEGSPRVFVLNLRGVVVHVREEDGMVTVEVDHDDEATTAPGACVEVAGDCVADLDPVAGTGRGQECDECAASIPATTANLVNEAHADSCSLHPSNVA